MIFFYLTLELMLKRMSNNTYFNYKVIKQMYLIIMTDMTIQKPKHVKTMIYNFFLHNRKY